MVLGLLHRKRQKQGQTTGIGPRVLRILVDGKELLVRRLIRITPEEIVYVDFSGHIRVMRRERQRGKKRLLVLTT
ncbi:MAG: hypothetical protein GXO43_05800 [Crenarchaeota archaeon]|nr:hypothetical protein [Thermoproteota archaeon]